jgi:hypothetical protein
LKLSDLLIPIFRIPENYLSERKRRKIMEDLGMPFRKREKLPEDIEDFDDGININNSSFDDKVRIFYFTFIGKE